MTTFELTNTLRNLFEAHAPSLPSPVHPGMTLYRRNVVSNARMGNTKSKLTLLAGSDKNRERLCIDLYAVNAVVTTWATMPRSPRHQEDFDKHGTMVTIRQDLPTDLFFTIRLQEVVPPIAVSVRKLFYYLK